MNKPIILRINDDPLIIEIACLTLESAGFKVEAVLDGHASLRENG